MADETEEISELRARLATATVYIELGNDLLANVMTAEEMFSIGAITIIKDKSGVLTASSDNDPPLFCAATSLEGLIESLARMYRNVSNAPQQERIHQA